MGAPESISVVAVIASMQGRASFLQEALESLSRQTRQPNGVILVLEGQDPAWKNVLEVFSKVFPIQVIWRPKVTGKRGPAKNMGLRAVKRAQYVVLLDDDDLARPERIEIQVGFLESHRDYGWVAAPMEYFGTKGGIWPDPKGAGEITLETMIQGNRVLYSSVTLRSDILQQFSGFPETLEVGEDYAGWLELLEKGIRGYLLPTPVGMRRVHHGNVSKPGSLELEEQSIVIASGVRDASERGRALLAQRWRRWDRAQQAYACAFQESQAIKDWIRAKGINLWRWWKSVRW